MTDLNARAQLAQSRLSRSPEHLRPAGTGDESKSHRSLCTRINKTREALVKRQKPYELLEEFLALDQLCCGRARASSSSCWFSERTPHNGNRNKTELLLSSTKVPIILSTKGCDRGTYGTV